MSASENFKKILLEKRKKYETWYIRDIKLSIF